MNTGIRLYSLFVLSSFSILNPVFAFSEKESFEVTSVSKELRNQLKLSDFYQKRVEIGGFSVMGSKKVSDFALKEAAYLISKMTSYHPEYLERLADNKVRFSVMARDEFTTDIPEHADMTPAIFWDKRARGLGATRARPSVSCGEENLLAIEGDPYRQENILIHEFAHALHAMAINDLDPTFQSRLEKCFQLAIQEKIWEGTYAASNPAEYWAEAVQSWFDCNRENDREHGEINTREELISADLRIANLIEEKLGKVSWRYVHVSKRIASENHLDGYEPEHEKPFFWPKHLIEWHQNFEQGKVSLAPAGAKNAILVKNESLPTSEYSRKRCDFFVHNLSGDPVEMHWIDFEGKLKQPRSLRHKDHTRIQSFTGHTWRVRSAQTNSKKMIRFYKLPDAKQVKLVLLNTR